MVSLARVIEQVAGIPLADYARKHVFEPLGMKDTGYRPDRARCAATSAEGQPGVVHDELAGDYMTEDHQPGNAGVFSTGDDLARFCQALLKGDRILRPGTIRQMFTAEPDKNPAQSDRRGLGWVVFGAAPFAPGVGHTGFTGTLLWLDPARDRFCVLLSNRTYHGREIKVTRLRKAVLEVVVR